MAQRNAPHIATVSRAGDADRALVTRRKSVADTANRQASPATRYRYPAGWRSVSDIRLAASHSATRSTRGTTMADRSRPGCHPWAGTMSMAVTNIAHVKIGTRVHVMPGAR